MLNNNYNEFLPGLKDIIFEKSFTEGDNYHVYFHMPKKIHECPCCKTLISRDYEEKSVNKIFYDKNGRKACVKLAFRLRFIYNSYKITFSTM